MTFTLATRTKESFHSSIVSALEEMAEIKQPCEITKTKKNGEESEPLYEKIKVTNIHESYMTYVKWENGVDVIMDEEEFSSEIVEQIEMN